MGLPFEKKLYPKTLLIQMILSQPRTKIISDLFQVNLEERFIEPHGSSIITYPAGQEKKPFYKRRAKIYFTNVNSMQKTPIYVRSGWKIQFEIENIYKTKNMGWTFSDDGASTRLLECYSLEEAVQICHNLGNFKRSML